MHLCYIIFSSFTLRYTLFVKNINKYLSVNIVSFIGYVCFLINFTFLIFVVPNVKSQNNISNDLGMPIFFYFGIKLLHFYLFYSILVLFLLILFLFEIFIWKKSFNVFAKIPKALFLLGIFFAISPFLFLIFIYIINLF